MLKLRLKLRLKDALRRLGRRCPSSLDPAVSMLVRELSRRTAKGPGCWQPPRWLGATPPGDAPAVERSLALDGPALGVDARTPVDAGARGRCGALAGEGRLPDDPARAGLIANLTLGNLRHVQRLPPFLHRLQLGQVVDPPTGAGVCWA